MQMAAGFGIAQSPQCLGLDLSSTLACNSQCTADLLKRARLTIVNTITQTKDCALALIQLLQRRLQILVQQTLLSDGRRSAMHSVWNDIDQSSLTIFADRRRKRDGRASNVERAPHA